MTATAPAAAAHTDPDTIGFLLDYVLPGCSSSPECIRWPPDAFAVCAYLLKRTGAYVEVLRQWPPARVDAASGDEQPWTAWARDVGRRWRSVALTEAVLPQEVLSLWMEVISHRDTRLGDLGADRPTTCALLQLVAIADEASYGAGIPWGSDEDPFRDRAAIQLTETPCTLSPRSAHAGLRVLPKQHSPRSGLNLRSLTHHLSLHVGGEVTAHWMVVPQERVDHSLNLLIAPWPLRLQPSQFRAARGDLQEMPSSFGFMELQLREDPAAVRRWLEALMQEAERIGGRVDGVVFPEGALTPAEHEAVRELTVSRRAFLVAGVLRPSGGTGPGENLVVFSAPTPDGSDFHEVEQRKHHRWRLDRSQVEMYGLGASLNPARDWWEHIAITSREVRFFALNSDITICCLICEDLARQDPVADLVRNVGPNIVIALLMDGPQLGVRWPARYATVLAEDPGCSVLTVTSAGMVDLARPPRGARASRSIGLWKDARSDFTELELPQGASGMLLSLCTEEVEEWTADGRSDDGVTGYPRLGGFHPVFVSDAPVPRP